jgi:Flp pilus assembly protein TadD
MRSRAMNILCLSLFVGAMAGCAGMTATRQDTETPNQRAMAERVKAVESARTSFRAAKFAGCEIAAPFEYYMAQEYLQLAEKELAEGDKNHVFLFAENSKAHSTKAIDLAKGGTR